MRQRTQVQQALQTQSLAHSEHMPSAQILQYNAAAPDSRIKIWLFMQRCKLLLLKVFNGYRTTVKDLTCPRGYSLADCHMCLCMLIKNAASLKNISLSCACSLVVSRLSSSCNIEMQCNHTAYVSCDALCSCQAVVDAVLHISIVYAGELRSTALCCARVT
jgi:hypothetical protein